VVQRKSLGAPVSGHLTYVERGAQRAIVRSVDVLTLAIAGNTATFAGTCRINGAVCSFTATVTDNGEPGVDDRFAIVVQGGPSGAGVLRSGNIQLHREAVR
jgi:hypothetical protein